MLFVLALISVYNPAIAETDLSTTKQERANAEEAIASLKQELDGIVKTLDAQRTAQSKQQSQLRKIDLELARVAEDGHQLKVRVTALNEELQTLSMRKTELEKGIAAQQQGIAQRLRLLSQLQGQNQLSQWLAHRQPEKSQRNMVALEIINRDTGEKLAELNDQQVTLDLTRESIAQNQRETSAQLKALNKKQLALDKQRKKRREFLAKLEAELQQNETLKLAKLEDQASLQMLIQKLTESERVMQLASKKRTSQQSSKQARINTNSRPKNSNARSLNFAEARGNLNWPARGSLQQLFGKRKTGSSRKWQGMTIQADEGEPVSSIYDGTVIFADYLPAQGLLMIIDHGQGYWSLYGRNESLLRQVGDYVERGEVIATMGASGGHTQTALYFEIRQSGTPQNPSDWCTRKA